MKMFSSTLSTSKATALLVAIISLASTAELSAQATFNISITGGNGSSGATTSLATVGALYQVSGTTPGNNITPLTFGQSFTITSTGLAGDSTRSVGYFGTNQGTAIPNGTAMPVSWNFTLGVDSNINSGATWSLTFEDPRDTAHGPINSQLMASGSLTAASTFISGSNTFNFNTGSSVIATSNLRAKLDFTFTSNNSTGQGQITATMGNTGFGGQGITLNASAIPEPSTYAAMAGAAMLGFAVWRRRSRKNPPAVSPSAATA